MKSLADIQAALTQVVAAPATDRITNQRAGRILFDLEQAASPFRQPSTPSTITA